MSKVSKKISKNISKVNNEKIENFKKKESNQNTILTISKIAFGILVLILSITIISMITSSDYKFEDTTSEVVFSTSEIIAGETFNRNEETYYVAFYDFSSTDSSLESTISSLTSGAKIYKVDISNGLNKNIIDTNSNNAVQTANDLKINDVTVIKISSGKNVEYTTGFTNCTNYLKAIG